jgi:hypothetical protein
MVIARALEFDAKRHGPKFHLQACTVEKGSFGSTDRRCEKTRGVRAGAEVELQMGKIEPPVSSRPTPSRAHTSRMGTGIGRLNRPEKVRVRCRICVR